MTFTVGSSAEDIAFDGTNMWVTNYGGNTVTELSPTGATLGTSPWATSPVGIAFDGTNMWVTNGSGNSVTELSPSGATLGTFAVGSQPGGDRVRRHEHVGHQRRRRHRHRAVADRRDARHLRRGPARARIAFDGTNMWILGDGVEPPSCPWVVWSRTPTPWAPSRGARVRRDEPVDPTQSSGIVKLPTGGGAAETYPAPAASGQAPTTIVFDGTSMWLGVRNVQSSLPSNTVFELSLCDTTIGTFVVGPNTVPMGFDGRHILVMTDNGYESL